MRILLWRTWHIQEVSGGRVLLTKLTLEPLESVLELAGLGLGLDFGTVRQGERLRRHPEVPNEGPLLLILTLAHLCDGLI